MRTRKWNLSKAAALKKKRELEMKEAMNELNERLISLEVQVASNSSKKEREAPLEDRGEIHGASGRLIDDQGKGSGLSTSTERSETRLEADSEKK